MPVYLRPAGQFTTTARDLAVFGAFLLGDGRVDGRPLVAPSLLRAMGRPTTTDANLLLGRIDPASFVGGEVEPDWQAVDAAFAGTVARHAGVDRHRVRRLRPSGSHSRRTRWSRPE